MEIKDYKAPQTKVVEVKSQGVLCSSQNGQTDSFSVNNENATDDNDWE